MAVLLLTATVTPPRAATNLARTDPQDRLRDYALALHFYMQQLDKGVFDSLVFVENSNSDISILKSMSLLLRKPAQIEFISFDGLDYPPENGRAYGEMVLIDHAMEHSSFIQAAGPAEIVWKATGRYMVNNLEALMAPRAGADLYCQCRDFPTRWADMYFMGWTKQAYADTLGGCSERIRERPGSGASELEFRKLIDEKATVFQVQRRFPAPPEVSGTRGWDNRRYEKQQVKSAFRRLAAYIAPWAWV